MKLKLIGMTIAIATLSFLFISCTEQTTPELEQSSSESVVSSSESVVSSSESAVSSSENIASSSKSTASSSKVITSSEASSNVAQSAKPDSATSSSNTSVPPISSSSVSQPMSSVVLPGPVNQAGELDIATIKQDIIRYTNELRAKMGLNPLKHNVNLDNVADLRAQEMLDTGVFSHTRPDGRDTWTAFSDLNVAYLQAGENLGYAETNGVQDINNGYYWYSMWENSEGHYANLVKPEFTDIGVSLRYKLVGDMYYVYATQIFAKY